MLPPLNKIAAIVKLARSKLGGRLLKSTIVVKQLVAAQGYNGDRFDCEGMQLSSQNLGRFGDFKSLHVADVGPATCRAKKTEIEIDRDMAFPRKQQTGKKHIGSN